MSSSRGLGGRWAGRVLLMTFCSAEAADALDREWRAVDGRATDDVDDGCGLLGDFGAQYWEWVHVLRRDRQSAARELSM